MSLKQLTSESQTPGGINAQALKELKKNGKLVLEIGHNQKDRVLNMLKNNGFFIQKFIKDLGQNNRCITSIKI